MDLTRIRNRPKFDKTPEISHKELVKQAGVWLKNYTQTHTIVITELTTSARETPDAIGFDSGGFSTLIECKATRADFFADKKKHFRMAPSSGMGHRRYFMTPVGLLKPEELPEDWGLIEVYEKTESGRRKRYLTVPPNHLSHINERAQTGMLVSVMRRLEISTAVFIRQG